MKDVFPAILFFMLGSLSIIWMTATSIPEGKGAQYAILTSPWEGKQGFLKVVERSATQIVRFGAAANIGIVTTDIPHQKQKLYEAGAWLVFNPVVTGFCFPIQQK
ncbi:hypothetical protein [Terasakiella sp. SH-1]|uniref:hypothetical protein n=1 Tax=Terasakiella sp. SH-1 TaxID=2560057 RepID=UPI001073ED2A|nr:hypothetical protein [Terasakiella sp. SH-1]